MATTRNAGIISRSIAALVDLLTVLALIAGLYLAVVFVLFLIDVRNVSFFAVPWLFTVPGFLVMCILYQSVCWTIFGHTLGQAVMGLRVRRRKSDQNLHVLQAVVRASFCTLFPLGLAWVVFSKRRQSVQDMVARTTVVYNHAAE